MSAALLIPDFSTGSPGDDDDAGRLVRFTIEQVVSMQSLPLPADTVNRYDHNPN